MKRIIATLLLTFISSLILNNFFAGLSSIEKNTLKYNGNFSDVKKNINEDTTKLNLLKENDTLRVNNLKVSKQRNKKVHHATWYHTRGTRVHREYPTAAYNFAPRGTKLRVINVSTGDTTIVEVTDRMGNKSQNKIDLSHMAFGQISKHGHGRISVIVEIID
jgi:rare lipoprotein A (peptidoglycan hydrolase)